MNKSFKIALMVFLILGSMFFLVFGLVKGKAFLVPLTTAIILSMVMNPVAKKFMHWGIGRGLAVFFADLIVVLFIGFMIFLLAAQANKVADNWSQIERRLQPIVHQVQQFVHKKMNTPLLESGGNAQSQSSQNQSYQSENPQSQQENQQNGQQQGQNAQNQKTAQQQESQGQIQQGQQKFGENRGGGFGNLKTMLTSVVKSIFNLLSNMLLILVYIFFFMYYQRKFEDAILGFTPGDRKEKAKDIINKLAANAQQYLFGRFILIAILAGLYIVGYSIIGLKYALFISLIAALFSLIPYLGNVIGLVLALAASFVSGGGSGQVIAIIAIFGVIQFVESYALEPFVVGGKVDLNPVIIIVGVVFGGLIWGIMGMILAIPILGIFKVIFDNIDELKPLGYVLDERGISTGAGWSENIKEWFKKKFGGNK
jgi:predicted PurR-regulated permease PerM